MTQARVECAKASLNGASNVPDSSALLRFRYLFDEKAAAEAIFAATSARRKHSERRRIGANAPLYTKLSRTTVNFFPLVYFGCQCRSIRDCTAPISPSTQARRAAMAKKRKAKAAAKKTKKRRKKK
jgi:hypothetical protein